MSPKNGVEVALDTKKRGLSAAWAKRIIAGTLAREKKAGRSVSALLTGDRRIRALNKKYLRHDYATDVISFGLDGGPPAESGMLGDIVVSVETAEKTARRLGIPFKEELARYLVHGTLHLLGYDDRKTAERKRMHARQERILGALLGKRKVR